MGKKGILLLNLGGPDSLEAVRPFLYNLFSDRDIIRLGPSFLQRPIAWIISKRRYKKTQAAYSLIGGRSPIKKITGQQAAALQKELGNVSDIEVFVGMRYWHPFIEDTLAEMKKKGIDSFLALSLYPQYSIATTGSAYSEVKRNLDKFSMECFFADPWYDHPKYIESIALSVKRGVPGDGSLVRLLYSAHSLPKSFIEEGDPYVDHIKTTVELVNNRLKDLGLNIMSHLSYQSRSGPVEWLEPSTDEMIRKLGKEGVRELFVVPISFVSDHIETLYEIDMLYRDLASKHGIMLRRIESLNANALFIEALKDVALRSFPSVMEAG